MSRIVVPVSTSIASLLAGMLILMYAGIVSIELFAFVTPLCLLVLWAMGDWRTPQERAALLQPVRKRPFNRPGLGS